MIPNMYYRTQQARSGIASGRGTVRNEPTEAIAISGRERVECVEERREPERAQEEAERSGEPDPGNERDASAPVARHRPAVPKHEPPAFAAPLPGDRGEQLPRFLVREREKGQFLASIERGDDPRRPTAEPSAAGIEEHRPREAGAGRRASPRFGRFL